MRVLLIMTTATLFLLTGPAWAQMPVTKTLLSAEQEVPTGVESEARGLGVLRFNPALRYADVHISWRDLVGNFTRVHLHCARAGENGPVAVGFVDMVSSDSDNSDAFTLVPGVVWGRLTNAEFPETDACTAAIERPVNNIASLAAAINDGLIYFNIHTDTNPGGELRGQVRPIQ